MRPTATAMASWFADSRRSWLRQASTGLRPRPCACHRRCVRRELMMRIVVLGGGVVGVASAYWVMQDGHQVELVERREAAGMETSWGNGAVIQRSTVEPWSAPGVPMQIL